MRSLLACCLLLCTAATADDLDFDRTGLGTSTLPIWSELSPFETHAVNRIPAARSGDPDALLALYLLASGDPLGMGDYEKIRDELDQWITTLPLSGDPREIHRDARLLFIGMHTEYLGTEMSSTAPPERYREDQSRMSRIFTTGEFNCISSTMLYIVVARKLGLDAEGVLLPSHSFVQLDLSGELVEVETTSFNGFDVVHDEAFYEPDSSAWFSSRSLEPPSWEDYRNREFIGPAELGFFNMINQHTIAERMTYRDRMRLAELRGHFLPGDESAQKSRLAFYYQEFAYLQEAGDYATARRMYDRIQDYLTGLERNDFADPELLLLLTAVQSQMADTLVRTGSPEAGLALARRLLQTRPYPESAAMVESHLYSVVSGYAVERAEQADYPGARLAFDALEVRCLQNRVCSSGLAQVYSAWAMHYVEAKDWGRSADIYREYLLLDSTSKLADYFTNNLQRVYLNWAAAEEWNGEWESAMAVLDQCTRLLDTAKDCESALAELDAKHEAGYL